MSNFCTPCRKTKPMLSCSGVITVGTIAQVNTDVYVLIVNNTTGNKHTYKVTSDTLGVVKFNSEIQYNSEHSYTLYVLKDNFVNLSDIIPINIGTQSYDCLSLTFTRVENISNSVQLSGNQTIQIL